MKTLKNNKVLAWMLAVITACCAFLGVIFSFQVKTAHANMISENDLPDFSTMESSTLKVGDNVLGKWIVFDAVDEEWERISLNFYIDETVSNLVYCKLSPTTISDSSGYIVGTNTIYDCYITEDETSFYIFIDPEVTSFNISNASLDKTQTVTLEEDDFVVTSINGEITCYYTEPEVQPDVDETPDAEKDKPLSDKVADFINENTGLAVTGSLVTIVAIGAVVYFVFFRKRR